jgi:hypothetical protein
LHFADWISAGYRPRRVHQRAPYQEHRAVLLGKVRLRFLRPPFP